MNSLLLVVFAVAVVPGGAFVPSTGAVGHKNDIVSPTSSMGTSNDVDVDVGVSPSRSHSRSHEVESARRRAIFGSIVASTSAYSMVASSPLRPTPPMAYAIDTYLTEPTEEFKESERQRLEFRRVQLALKGDFVKVLARLTGESNTESELIGDLVELRELVVRTGGLPLGIKKEDMYKVIRSKKAKGYWPTNVEIAYQKLKSEIAYQQSPNTEKDMENPL
ncbi:hypothetical protein ACHAXA_008962 [Cyclostephanos tholiformis]|uniref:Uncharacterized protein n=1 Tax=Cyclostephanos tholiformis TaxID=382380 RepID=A0ABD3SBU8_9STRA